MNCDHRLGWGHLNIECDQPFGHDGDHIGSLHATRVHWLEGDRRDYTGKRLACLDDQCVLPGGHRGDHAH